MLFGTFQAGDFFNKPLVNEKNKVPEGLFKGDVSHGIIWCFPITENFVKSLVNICTSCPNFGQVLVVFESEDYHKVDKLKWYKAIAEVNHPNVWEFINDSVEDDYAEFIVPYKIETLKHMYSFQNLGFGLSENGTPDNVTGISIFGDAPSVLSRENQRIFPYATESMVFALGDLGTYEDCVSDDEILARQHIIQTILFRTVSLFYAPLLIATAINSRLLTSGVKDESRFVKYMQGWERYAKKFTREFYELHNLMTEWSRHDLTLNGYISIREKFADFYCQDINVIIARLEGINRNAPCPCKSGKKFKKCHGKGFV